MNIGENKDEFCSYRNFEKFIFSVLRQKLSLENKRFYTYEDVTPNSLIKEEVNKILNRTGSRSMFYDAYAPDGIDDYKEPYFIEIKYVKNDKYRVADYMLNDNVLLITNAQHVFFNKLGTNEKIIIWNKDIIDELKKQYSIDYYASIEDKYLELSELDFEYKNSNNFELLKRDIKDKRISLALGAGISLEYGSKSWGNLVDDLYNEIQSNKIIDNAEDIKKKIGGTSIINGQFVEDNLKDFCKSLQYEIYGGYSGSISDPKYNDTTLRHLINFIDKMKNERRFNIISYNYDYFLEKLLESNHIKYNLIFHDQNVIDDMLSIYHPHGYLPLTKYKYERDAYRRYIVFGESEYHSLYNNPYSWQMIIQEYLYRESQYLFVGCSMTDPNLRRILENVKINNRCHYAFMLEDGCSKKDKFIIHKHFMKLGVECIWCKNESMLKILLDAMIS